MIDVFAALQNSSHLAYQVELHNVLLVDITPGPDIYGTITVKYQGEFRTVVGGGGLNNIGKFGYLVRATPISSENIPAGGCYFRAYLDQSLRRVPELDDLRGVRASNGQVQSTVGWWCESNPAGFLAPAGLIPGENGGFIPDETVAVSVRVPPEFVRECRSVQRSPEEVLHGFIGDLAGISNYANRPRADRFDSHGSDERLYAENWLDRTYGLDRVDVYALEAQDDEQASRQFDYDDLSSMLDDYLTAGGAAGDLLKAVQALVEKQESERENKE